MARLNSPRCAACKQFLGQGDHVCLEPGKQKSKTNLWLSEEGREYRAEYQREWRRRNPTYIRDYNARNREALIFERHRLRIMTLEAYGGTPPKCACCSEHALEFLTLDHVAGGGNADRKANGHKGGTAQYRALRKNGFPPGFRVLCWNCNSAIGIHGYCPHQKSSEAP